MHTRFTWARATNGEAMLDAAARGDVGRLRLVLAASACVSVALVHLPAGEARPQRMLEFAAAHARGRAGGAAALAAERDAWDAVDEATSAAARAAAHAATWLSPRTPRVAVAAFYDADAAAEASRLSGRRVFLDAARDEAQRRMAGLVREHVPWSVLDARTRGERTRF